MTVDPTPDRAAKQRRPLTPIDKAARIWWHKRKIEQAEQRARELQEQLAEAKANIERMEGRTRS